ncbi:glycerophosphoryl diester phosphodiesterase [Pseudonocardia thermophila]|uniref:Glycerophosphoryl diester phosphodiesterase n=1 Tax=Pseudonocardia thermophila TaxID=1848 RepID=A0A1M6N7W0_PSETH|nr:glycerophosphodiester phosphodiesterase family protein [Pseudonocardia thermophila]SHJ91779.1 glycerophosphoryl diester phosphodiesterase [Pseudonocardia thermophila]
MERHPYLDGPYPRAYAHRGWHTGDLAGLENTFAAFSRAVEEGFTYLELDVHASLDGIAVVHHDSTLDRTTDGTGRVADFPAAELAEVKVGGREPIPLLEQVLADLPDTRVTIELKAAAAVTPVLTVLEKLDAWDRVCVGSYRESWLAAARASAGDRLCTSLAYTSALGLRGRAWLDRLPGPLSRLPSLPVAGALAQLPHRYGPVTVVDEAFLRTAHAGGREVHVWTIDDPAEMTHLLDIGVDGLLSDRPDVLREVLRARDAWPES